MTKSYLVCKIGVIFPNIYLKHMSINIVDTVNICREAWGLWIFANLSQQVWILKSTIQIAE